MSRTIDRQLVCSEAFSWEALPIGAPKYVVVGGTIKDLNLRKYAVLNCGFTLNIAHDKAIIMSLPEEDLTCPICCDIFTDPVLLFCSHSFCRSCLKRCWDTGLRECPVCRKKASKSSAPSNLALKNVCEAVMQVRRQSSLLEEKMNCNLHGEKLKLFCLVDKQPICVVCQASKLHKTHDCSPVEEAVQDCKVREVNISMCFPTTL